MNNIIIAAAECTTKTDVNNPWEALVYLGIIGMVAFFIYSICKVL